MISFIMGQESSSSNPTGRVALSWQGGGGGLLGNSDNSRSYSYWVCLVPDEPIVDISGMLLSEV